MGTVKEVGSRIPGITFHVRAHELKGTITGKLIGTTTLVADVSDRALWDNTIKKLEGLRLFAQGMKDEFIDALSEEVDTNANELAEAKEALRLSRIVVVQKDAALSRLSEELLELRTRYDSLVNAVRPISEQLGIPLPP